MNKKYLVIFFFLVLLLVPFSVVRAEETSATTSSSARGSLMEAKLRREELQKQLKLRMENARLEWASKSAELKDRLKTVKDERKQRVVENVASRISNRNGYWITHWNNVLTRLSSILTKIEERAVTASSNGKDITSVTAAVTSAKTAISVAQEKVDAQATKTYTVDVTTESKLGTDVSSTISSFKTDVSSVVSSINDARKAVQEAFKALKSLVS